jgi:hypothetical protein
MATRVVAPASEIAQLSKQRDPYYNQYLQLLTSSAQTGLQQSTEQIQQQTSANIAQAYSNYLSQQRTFAENPTISTGDVARLSEQGQSAYSAAYQAYKAKEAKDIYSTAMDYEEQLESSISKLDKQYENYGSKIRQVEESLLEYMPSAVNKYYAEQVSSGKMTQEEVDAILADENLYNKSDLTKEYLIALGGVNEQGESFYTTLLRDNPDLADWAIQNRELFERTTLGDYYTDTANLNKLNEQIEKISSEKETKKFETLISQKGVIKSDEGLYYQTKGKEYYFDEIEGDVYTSTGEKLYDKLRKMKVGDAIETSKGTIVKVNDSGMGYFKYADFIENKGDKEYIQTRNEYLKQREISSAKQEGKYASVNGKDYKLTTEANFNKTPLNVSEVYKLNSAPNNSMVKIDRYNIALYKKNNAYYYVEEI